MHVHLRSKMYRNLILSLLANQITLSLRVGQTAHVPCKARKVYMVVYSYAEMGKNMAALTLALLALLHVATGRVAVGGKLLEFSCSQRQMYGKYSGQDGVHGITFFSGPDNYLLVRSFSGVNIVETSPFSGTDGKELRAVYIMGFEYIQHISRPHSDNPVDHNTPLSDALEKILDMKEIGLLEEAAEAVGQRGISGRNTPVALPFFMFALRLTQLHIKGAYLSNNTLSHRQQRQLCYNTCPPCPDYDCYGMCGYGCNCWPWVCGDCCFHIGCYYHDICCRQSFSSTSCILPFNLDCNSPYRC